MLEYPLRADIALVKGSIVDEFGNTMYKGTTKNFNPIMAMASDVVIVEAEKFVNTGEINKEMIMTPGVVIDYIIKEAN
ncbi:CoA-transferase [Paraclostridium sp. AKS73]|uniref:CoA-transferase n=1 Tax=Paraclostridium sp. AKS73 TaxID=2876116 RepID=UPI002FE6D917